jgi:hypothetical protein
MKKIIIASLIALLSVGVRGADIQTVMRDVQRIAQKPKKITLVFWIPTEFWSVATRGDTRISDELRAQFSTTVNDYLVFMIASAEMGNSGGMTTKDRAAIEANTELLIGGKSIAPIGKNEVSPDVLRVVDRVKPMMANLAGQIGQGIEILIYPNPAPGAEKLSAVKPGAFSISVFGDRFDWRLPLGSLLPPKVDSRTKESFPGDYNYNPYTGDKLSAE